MENNTLLIALVGMPGSGKSSVVSYMSQKNIPFVRFGTITDEKLMTQHLPQTPENERIVREQLRKTEGMDVYAKRSLPGVTTLMNTNAIVGIDGLYSWEEYIFLKLHFPTMILVHVFAEKAIRYHRLTTRAVRPFTVEQAKDRDVAEIENLHKGGPIAIADYLIDNSTTLEELHEQVKELCAKLKA